MVIQTVMAFKRGKQSKTQSDCFCGMDKECFYKHLAFSKQRKRKQGFILFLLYNNTENSNAHLLFI